MKNRCIMKIKVVSSVMVSSFLFSCAVQQNNPIYSEAKNADDLLIVDCLLPGQVRKLGQIATYVTARRAIKTSAVECEVRGGEYVAYDRANLSTALNIWSPKAQSGDPEAQNYVGEIYEKGLGVNPDYEMALVWYKKAARQGNSKAQMNLGYLYEKGLGVPVDQTIAFEWYAKSSKLSNSNIQYESSLSTAQQSTPLSAELKLLKAALKNSQIESNHLKQKLLSIQDELSNDKERLGLLQKDFILAQRKIQSEQHELQDTYKIDALNQKLEGKTQEIRSQQVAVEKLEDEYKRKVAVLTETLADTQKRAKQIVDALKNDNKNAETSQVALLQMEVKLAETEKRLLDVSNLSHQRLTALDMLKGKADSHEQSLHFVDKELKQSHQQIKQYKQDKARLSAQVESDQELKETYLLEISDKVAEVEVLKQSLIAEKSLYESEIKALKKTVRGELVTEKPSIEIIDPPFVLTRGMPMVTLRSVASHREIIGKVESSVGLLSLLINDLKRKVNEQGLFKTDVELHGNETPVKIVAIDNNGKKSSLDFVLSMESAIQRSVDTPSGSIGKREKNWGKINFGNYHALIIANNDYQKVPKLETPVTDAQAVEKILSAKYGFKTKLLINGTRYQILSELNKLRATLTENDNLLVYYAGHGELDKVNMRGHWLPIDADGDNTANWISTVAITDILNSMAAQHVMVVSDSCYSGAMTRSSLARLDAGVTHKQRNDWLKAMLKARSRTVLTSGGLKPVMDGGGGQHSVFARAFIEALGANSELLEGQALYRNVSNNIVSIAAGYGIEQVPEYAPIRHAGHESGEFFFVPK